MWSLYQEGLFGTTLWLANPAWLVGDFLSNGFDWIALPSQRSCGRNFLWGENVRTLIPLGNPSLSLFPWDFPISPLTIVEHGYNDDVKLYTFYAFAFIWTLSLDFILTVTLVGKVDCFEVFFNIARPNPGLCVDFHLSSEWWGGSHSSSHNMCKNFISYHCC